MKHKTKIKHIIPACIGAVSLSLFPFVVSAQDISDTKSAEVNPTAQGQPYVTGNPQEQAQATTEADSLESALR